VREKDVREKDAKQENLTLIIEIKSL